MRKANSENLVWNAAEVAKVMARRGIPHREELARRIKKPATSVRRSLNEAWEGEITGPILVALCRELQVPAHKLIRDPRHY